MSYNNLNERNGDRGMIVRAANSAVLTMAYRVSVPVLVAYVLFFGGRFVGHIDEMSKGLDGLALTMMKVATTVEIVSKRVEGLEHRERQPGWRGP